MNVLLSSAVKFRDYGRETVELINQLSARIVSQFASKAAITKTTNCKFVLSRSHSRAHMRLERNNAHLRPKPLALCHVYEIWPMKSSPNDGDITEFHIDVYMRIAYIEEVTQLILSLLYAMPILSKHSSVHLPLIHRHREPLASEATPRCDPTRMKHIKAGPERWLSYISRLRSDFFPNSPGCDSEINSDSQASKRQSGSPPG